MPPKVKSQTPEDILKEKIIDKLEDGLLTTNQYRNLMELLAEGKQDMAKKAFESYVAHAPPKPVYVEPEPAPVHTPSPGPQPKAKGKPGPKPKGTSGAKVKKEPPPKTPKEILGKLLNKKKISMYVYHDLMEKLAKGQFADVMSTISTFTNEAVTQPVVHQPPPPSSTHQPTQPSTSVTSAYEEKLLKKIKKHADAIIALVEKHI